MIFKSFVGPECPPELRNRLYDLAQENSFPNTVKKLKAAEQWYTFYAVKGMELNLSDLESKEIPDLAKKIWRWCEQQFADDKFQRMNKCVAPLLQSLPVASQNKPEAPLTGSLA